MDIRPFEEKNLKHQGARCLNGYIILM